MSTSAAPHGRILIVEDDLDVLEVLKLMLEGEGHDRGAGEARPRGTRRGARQAVRHDRHGRLDARDERHRGRPGTCVPTSARPTSASSCTRPSRSAGCEERFTDYDLFVAKADDTDRLVKDIARLLSAPRVPRGSERIEPMYSPEEVLRAQCALRSAIGLGDQTFPEHTFIDMLGGEIEQLRKIGKTSDEIEALISGAIGRPLTPAAVQH